MLHKMEINMLKCFRHIYRLQKTAMNLRTFGKWPMGTPKESDLHEKIYIMEIFDKKTVTKRKNIVEGTRSIITKQVIKFHTTKSN